MADERRNGSCTSWTQCLETDRRGPEERTPETGRDGNSPGSRSGKPRWNTALYLSPSSEQKQVINSLLSMIEISILPLCCFLNIYSLSQLRCMCSDWSKSEISVTVRCIVLHVSYKCHCSVAEEQYSFFPISLWKLSVVWDYFIIVSQFLDNYV